jgi:roadblock/LC7 domain-containing protein
MSGENTVASAMIGALFQTYSLVGAAMRFLGVVGFLGAYGKFYSCISGLGGRFVAWCDARIFLAFGAARARLSVAKSSLLMRD